MKKYMSYEEAADSACIQNDNDGISIVSPFYPVTWQYAFDPDYGVWYDGENRKKANKEMSTLISFKNNEIACMASDSRSTRKHFNSDEIFTVDNYQKIFPLREHSAIVGFTGNTTFRKAPFTMAEIDELLPDFVGSGDIEIDIRNLARWMSRSIKSYIKTDDPASTNIHLLYAKDKEIFHRLFEIRPEEVLEIEKTLSFSCMISGINHIPYRPEALVEKIGSDPIRMVRKFVQANILAESLASSLPKVGGDVQEYILMNDGRVLSYDEWTDMEKF